MKNFSNIEEDKKIFRNEHYFIIRDGFPVSPGHLLIISNEIRKDYFELSDEEKSNLPVVIEEAKKLIENKFNNGNIRYIKNNSNIGMDLNFEKCIINSNSKYIWFFGQDDYSYGYFCYFP